MDRDVKVIYKNIKKIIFYIDLVFKKEKIILKKDELFLKIFLYLLNDSNVNILLDEMNLCINENIESQNCIKQIKKYITSLTNVNFSTKENIYYLLTADEYLSELLNIKNSRTLYIKEKYRECINAIKGIQYFNPNNESRNEIKEKIKIYNNFFEKSCVKHND